jgi:hypothetical protein
MNFLPFLNKRQVLSFLLQNIHEPVGIFIVTFTPSVEKKLVDVSRTQIISSQKQTERGKSISDLSLFLHSKRQKR